jgi:hypothetical protein
MLTAALRRLARLGQGDHVVSAVNVGRRNAHASVVSVSAPQGGAMDEKHLSEEELEGQDGEPLPERTQMSVIQPGATPVPIVELPPGDTLPVEPPESA